MPDVRTLTRRFAVHDPNNSEQQRKQARLFLLPITVAEARHFGRLSTLNSYGYDTVEAAASTEGASFQLGLHTEYCTDLRRFPNMARRVSVAEHGTLRIRLSAYSYTVIVRVPGSAHRPPDQCPWFPFNAYGHRHGNLCYNVIRALRRAGYTTV